MRSKAVLVDIRESEHSTSSHDSLNERRSASPFIAALRRLSSGLVSLPDLNDLWDVGTLDGGLCKGVIEMNE